MIHDTGTTRRRLADHFGAGDGWTISESGLSLSRLGARESLFAVGNGYLGVRGTPEEGGPAEHPGVILNGFHETWPIVYPEDAYGMARTGQTTVNATDGSIIRLFVDDEPFDLTTARVLRCERTLDLRTGVLRREVEFETGRGVRLLLRSRRLASLEHRHLAALDYEVHALDERVAIAISSELVTHAPSEESGDPRSGRGFGLVPLEARAGGRRALLRLGTRESGLELACGMEHRIDGASSVSASAEGDRAGVVVLADLEPGMPLRLSKYVAYHWAAAGADLDARVERTLDRAARHGYDALEREHAAHVAEFWKRSDVVVEGAPEVQLAVRFNLFQLLQATARSEGHGVAAKGVTGHGYEGHYFWDTEVYVAPFLMHTSPRWAHHVLAFRCRMLDAARERAAELGHRGALYPWRTINGKEASPRYASGTAQYHINADVAYALRQHRNVTGDDGLLLHGGAEVLVETARVWMGLGFYSERRDGRFCINSVTGPDEYTTVVNNNAYTNLMAKEHLEGAVGVLEWLRDEHTAKHDRLAAALGVTEVEVASWRRAAARMYVPRHDELGIVLQDDDFLERKRWDFEGTPAERYPLLLHFHPLEIFRHQVIKQTDVVLATYLVGHHFSAAEKRRTFDYYDPLTTGDSTLSACIQSIVASEIGYAGAALEYFLEACAVDLLDAHGNTADGVHIASCGGTWLALVAGFAGLRDFDGVPRFDPRLPAGWERLRFRLRLRGRELEVDMTPGETAYSVLDGEPLELWHQGEAYVVRRGLPLRVTRQALAA